MVHPEFVLKDPSLLLATGWINNQPVKSPSGNAPFPCHDPATDEVWTHVETFCEKDTELAIAAAYDAFPKYAATPSRERARLLLAWEKLIKDNKEDLAKIIVMESGKALCEALAEVDYACTYAFFFAGECERIQGESIKATSNPAVRFVTQKVPIGPVALLCPWNFPLAVAVRKMGAALAAGCTIVIKPSPETPITTIALAQLAQRAGYTAGVINVVPASVATTPAVGKKLCEDPRIKKLSFTGSTAVGRLLMSQSSSSLKKMTLELGGNGGWIVFEDADLERAADALMANKLRHAGQVCVCANRIFAHRTVHDRFVALVKDRMSKLKFGHGLDDGVTNGALTTRRGAERAREMVEAAVKQGASVLLGGKQFGSGYHFQPTLVTGAPLDSRLYLEEQFAPIVSIYPFNSEDEVVRLCNDTDMGLTNYVFTSDLSRAWRCYEALNSGTVAINTANAISAESPFGGLNQSGFGKEGGIQHGVSEFCVVKTAAITL